MIGHTTRARFLFREINERGFQLPLGSVTKDGGVEFRHDLDISVWNPGDDTSSYKRVKPNDFVIGLRSFQSGIGHSSIETIVSPAYTVLRPTSSVIDSGYFRHLFKSDVFISRLENIAQGIRQGRTIATEDFYNLGLPVPGLEEQRAIADYLDAETARIDALIAKKQQLLAAIEERTSSVIFRGITGHLTSHSSDRRESGIAWVGPLPTHYGTPTLGANYRTQLGKMLNAEAASGSDQRPYLKNTNVKWDSFEMSDLPTMTFDSDDRVRCALRSGDLLVCEGGEVGRAAVWPGSSQEVYFQKALHRVRSIRDGNTRFLMYCLWAAATLNVFTEEGNQSTIVHLTGEKLREHRFPWPPPEEQGQIVEALDAQRTRASAIADRLLRQTTLLVEHRQALITSAVTGQHRIPRVAR